MEGPHLAAGGWDVQSGHPPSLRYAETGPPHPSLPQAKPRLGALTRSKTECRGHGRGHAKAQPGRNGPTIFFIKNLDNLFFFAIFDPKVQAKEVKNV